MIFYKIYIDFKNQIIVPTYYEVVTKNIWKQ